MRTMRTIAIINNKGGVGKTTTVINMAAVLSKYHQKRVLVVDADSQINTTEFYGADPARGNLAEVLRRTPDYGEFAVLNIQPTDYERIHILAGSEELMDLDLTKVELGSANAAALRNMVAYLEECDGCDYCLVDCPPAFNAASAAALVAADEVIIPVKLDAFGLQGMANLLRQIDNMRRINPRLRIAGILPTKWYFTTQGEAAEKTLRENGLKVFGHIRWSKKVDDMTWAQEPLEVCSPRSGAGVDYRRFVRQYLEGGDENG